MAITVTLSTVKAYATSSPNIESYTLNYVLGFEDPLHPGIYRDVLFDGRPFSFSDTCPFGDPMPTLNDVLDAIANDIYTNFAQYPTYIVFEGETYAYPRLEATINMSGGISRQLARTVSASIPISANLNVSGP